MASEDLLKKAVAAFKALSPEQQAEMLKEQRQSWVRGNVGLSRDERGMTSPMIRALNIVREVNDKGRQAVQAWADSNTRPAPAATDTGLETEIEHVIERLLDIQQDLNFEANSRMSQSLCDASAYIDELEAFLRRVQSNRSQAEELLAAERAKTERWHRKAMDAGVITHSDGTTSHPMRKERDDLKADNAAQAARIKELETERTMIVSHATMGQTDGIGLTVNDISVRVSALRNELYEEGRKQAEALGANLAARDAQINFLERAWRNAESRVEAHVAKLAAAEKALEPFANAADGRKSKSVTGSVCFSQHYLLAARAVLGGKPS